VSLTEQPFALGTAVFELAEQFGHAVGFALKRIPAELHRLERLLDGCDLGVKLPDFLISGGKRIRLLTREPLQRGLKVTARHSEGALDLAALSGQSGDIGVGRGLRLLEPLASFSVLLAETV
jgi:hypothetical protein